MPAGGTKLGRSFYSLGVEDPGKGEQDRLCSLSFPGISDATGAWTSWREEEGKDALLEPNLI